MNDGGPAFPNPVERSQGDFGTTDAYPGMTLRDWFAGQALAGTLAQVGDEPHTAVTCEAWAKWSYQVADAMLAARTPPAEKER